MITVAAPDTRAEPGLDERTFAEEPVRDMDKHSRQIRRDRVHLGSAQV